MTNERKKSVQSHVRVDDYFGTLATVLDLFRQDWKGRMFSRKNERLLLRLTDELLYLQEHYVIHARESAKVAETRLAPKSHTKKLSEEDKKILDAAAQRLADIFVTQIDEKKIGDKNNKHKTGVTLD